MGTLKEQECIAEVIWSGVEGSFLFMFKVEQQILGTAWASQRQDGDFFLGSFISCSWFGLLMLIFAMTQLRDWKQGHVKWFFYWKYSLTLLQLGAKLTCCLLTLWILLLSSSNTDLRRGGDPAVLFLLCSYLQRPLASWEHSTESDRFYLLSEESWDIFTRLLSHVDLLTPRAVILCLIDTLHHGVLTYFTCVVHNLLLLSEPSEHILMQFPWSIMQRGKWSHLMLTVSSAGWEDLMAETFIFTGNAVVTVF